MRRIAFIMLSATIPNEWTHEEVADEIRTLMGLSGETPKPELISVKSREEWRTTE